MSKDASDSTGMAYLAMLLWNGLVPTLFTGTPTLTFLQTWGLLFLLSLLGAAFRTTVTVRK